MLFIFNKLYYIELTLYYEKDCRSTGFIMRRIRL